VNPAFDEAHRKKGPAMVEIGKKAPAFTVEADTGEKVSLADYRDHKVVLFFFPKALTPG
jgi:peroxiredoxin Q/BCP